MKARSTEVSVLIEYFSLYMSEGRRKICLSDCSFWPRGSIRHSRSFHSSGDVTRRISKFGVLPLGDLAPLSVAVVSLFFVDCIVFAPSPLVYGLNTSGFRSWTCFCQTILPASAGCHFCSSVRLLQVRWWCWALTKCASLGIFFRPVRY